MWQSVCVDQKKFVGLSLERLLATTSKLMLDQGILTEGEGSVRLTSSLLTRLFKKIIFAISKAADLN